MPLQVPDLLLSLYHATSPTHRRAARQRKAEYQAHFNQLQQENIKRVRRMSQLRGEPSQDFLFDSAHGTGAASRARSRSVHDVQPAYADTPGTGAGGRRTVSGPGRANGGRPFSMIYDGTSAFPGAGYGEAVPALPPLPNAVRTATADGYVSSGSGYDSGLSGGSRVSGASHLSGASGPSNNSFEAPRRPGSIAPSLIMDGGSGATSRSTSGGIEMSGALGAGAGAMGEEARANLPSPPSYVDVATPVRLSRERPRPVSLGAGFSIAASWRGRSRSRSRGRKKKRADEWWAANGPAGEQEVGEYVQVVSGGNGDRELRMSAMVS